MKFEFWSKYPFTVNPRRITPSKAEELWEFNLYAGQRKMYQKDVDKLVRKIKAGLFHGGEIAVVHFQGKTYLVNGQHQILAIIELGVTLPVTFKEYHLTSKHTMEDVAVIYKQFDANRPRERSENARASAAGFGWENWPTKLIGNLSSALDALDSDDGYTLTRSAKDDAGSHFGDNQKFCEWAAGLLTEPKKNGDLKWRPGTERLRTVAGLAAMKSAWDRCQKDATAFFTAVRDGDELRKDDPRFKLRELLGRCAVRGGAKNAQAKVVIGEERIYIECIHHWNAWREGRITVTKYNKKSPIPKAA